MKNNNQELDQQELKNVSGGWEEQTKEISDFIRSHDPDYPIYNDSDIILWLKNKSGISFKRISTESEWYNSYMLSDGTDITHGELMGYAEGKIPRKKRYLRIC